MIILPVFILKTLFEQVEYMNLYIESLEGGYYVVATGNDETQKPVMADSGRPQTFNSVDQIREYFHGKHFDKVWLKQCTPYDEMVGQADNTEKTLDVEIAW
ncbi:DUF6482 family protein [Salinimonas lutimaris]|uniref:DUF6482 family protein n=1 Tax=Salinimonas lutimaris TaxID=914153 RepID=UPI0022B66B6E|nr:DUF6482 family protein [Salinimonas lutimaris]